MIALLAAALPAVAQAGDARMFSLDKARRIAAPAIKPAEKKPVQGISRYADGVTEGRGGLSPHDQKIFFPGIEEQAGLSDESLQDEDYEELNLDLIESDLLSLLKGGDKSDGKSEVKGFGEVAHIWPVSGYGRIASPFGLRHDPFSGKRAFHDGVDIAAPAGTAVMASASGVVAKTGEHKNLGKYVQVVHKDGTYSLYGHLRKITAEPRQKVAQGEKIGEVGFTGRATGPHLHYSLRVNARAVDPIAFLETGGKAVASSVENQNEEEERLPELVEKQPAPGNKPVDLLARFGQSS